MPEIILDPLSDTPIFMQVHDALVRAIARGELPVGARLESVRQLAHTLDINPATVKKAYDVLHREGIIVTSERRGSTVARPETPSDAVLKEWEKNAELLVAQATCQGIDAAQIRTIIRTLTR